MALPCVLQTVPFLTSWPSVPRAVCSTRSRGCCTRDNSAAHGQVVGPRVLAGLLPACGGWGRAPSRMGCVPQAGGSQAAAQQANLSRLRYGQGKRTECRQLPCSRACSWAFGSQNFIFPLVSGSAAVQKNPEEVWSSSFQPQDAQGLWVTLLGYPPACLGISWWAL